MEVPIQAITLILAILILRRNTR